MLYCKECGAQIEEDSKYCEVCGAEISKKIKVGNEARKESFEGELRKCPNCGDPIDAFEFICDKCGYNFSTDRKSTSQERLERMLSDIDSEISEIKSKDILKREELKGKKASCISSFSVSNSVEEVAAFMMYAAGNIDMSVLSNTGADPGDNKIAEAWIGKMEQMFHMATVSFADSEMFPRIEKVYREKKEEIQAAKKKKARLGLKFAVGFGGFYLLLFLVIGCFVLSHKSQEKKMEKIVQEVQEDIKVGDYDSALIKAQSIRMDDDWSSESTEYWDNRREELIELIKQKMEEER